MDANLNSTWSNFSRRASTAIPSLKLTMNGISPTTDESWLRKLKSRLKVKPSESTPGTTGNGQNIIVTRNYKDYYQRQFIQRPSSRTFVEAFTVPNININEDISMPNEPANPDTMSKWI